VTATDALFRLLADPTRRGILARGPTAVGDIAAATPALVASGISKHLMALRAAGLVVADWLWEGALAQLTALSEV